MRLSNVTKTKRKYDEINPSSSLEYVRQTFCPLFLLAWWDGWLYMLHSPKNTGTTDNLAWTKALLNELCITGGQYKPFFREFA